MFIKTARRSVSRSARAFTFPEMIIAVAVFSIVGTAVMSFFLYGLRTFATLYNYASLDGENRNAMDTMTREIRGALQVTSYTTNPATLSFINSDTNNVVYSFLPAPTSQLVRDCSDGSHTVLLNNCDLLQFQLYQRNPLTNVFDAFPTSTGNWSNTVKLIELTWRTSVNICPTVVTNSEDVQTARIVIRKAKTY
jgi:prepilin-type N-terminal cleavage/methylation domain-containing protein